MTTGVAGLFRKQGESVQSEIHAGLLFKSPVVLPRVGERWINFSSFPSYSPPPPNR
jgi:hypothetical protein